MSGIAWDTVEKALVAWVRAGTGLDAEHVYWEREKRPIPTGRYCTLRVAWVRQVGQDWVQTIDNPGGYPGEEVIHRARGTRVVGLNLRCFAGEYGAATGSTGPEQTLEAVRAAAYLPTARAALVKAGVGVGIFGDVSGFPGAVIEGTSLEPRAEAEIQLNLASEVEELGTYVEFVELERQAPAPAGSRYVPHDPRP